MSVLQINIGRNNKKRLRELITLVKINHRHIVAIQDPPNNIATQGFPLHHAIHEASDEPDEKGRAKRVAFLVPRCLAASAYTYNFISQHMASLTLETDFGSFTILNVYDHDTKQVAIQSIGDELDRIDILLGDFNLKHPRWNGDLCARRHHTFAKAEELLELTAEEWQLMNETGKGTWRRRDKEKEPQESVIDLTFVRKRCLQWFKNWEILDETSLCEDDMDAWDHKVLQTSFNIVPRFEARPFYQWKHVKRRDFNSAVADNFRRIELQPLQNESDINQFLNQIHDGMESPIHEHVPVVDLHVEAARREQRRQQSASSGLSTFLDHVDEINAKHGLDRLDRVLRSWTEPKGLPIAPPFKCDDQTTRTGDEKLAYLMRDIHGATGASRDCAREIPLPPQSNEPHDLGSDEVVSIKEVVQVLRTLKRDRNSGTDCIGSNALKMSSNIIAPYLAHLFTACLRLSIHPAYFKGFQTKMFPEPGKLDTLERPSSWRPIAIESCLGKVLEKIVANRLTDFAMQRKLVPDTQFGGLPGRSTTIALRLLISLVYAAWTTGFRATLLSLDIKGAFPRVDREVLLRNLDERGIPGWLVRYIHSFLSNRRSSVHLPGCEPREFFLNTGLPQGSPLSPILFLLFSAPLFDRVKAERNSCVFAFIDDIYILTW